MIKYYCIDNCGKIVSKQGNRCKSCANRYLFKIGIFNFSGKNNPKYKSGKPKCLDCGKELTHWRKGRCWECRQIGSLNPNWKNGISFEPYSFEFNNKLKGQIRKRDNSQCQLCGDKAKTVHHIDYNKLNSNPNNLIILCITCNSKVNFHRNFWQKYFNELIEHKGKLQQ